MGLAGGNPTLYAYVGNPLWEVDPFGLNPTEKWMRDYIREALGDSVHDGGAYFFKNADAEDIWYVGKADDLYRRLRSHLGSSSLVKKNLHTLGVSVNPNGSSRANFILEAKVIKTFKSDDVPLANEINSQGRNIWRTKNQYLTIYPLSARQEEVARYAH